MGWGEAVMGGDDLVKFKKLCSSFVSYGTCYLFIVLFFVMKPLVWMAIVLVKCCEKYAYLL